MFINGLEFSLKFGTDLKSDESVSRPTTLNGSLTYSSYEFGAPNAYLVFEARTLSSIEIDSDLGD